MSEPGLFI